MENKVRVEARNGEKKHYEPDAEFMKAAEKAARFLAKWKATALNAEDWLELVGEAKYFKTPLECEIFSAAVDHLEKISKAHDGQLI